MSRTIWYPTLDKANLRHRNPYQTRHTYATLLLASGESPEWIAKQMGHSTITMLFRVYSRFVRTLLVEMVVHLKNFLIMEEVKYALFTPYRRLHQFMS